MDEEHSADDERSEFQPETPNTSEVSTDSDEHVMQDSIEPATEANEEQGGPVSSSSRRGLLTALGTVGLLGIAGTGTASAEVLSGTGNTAPQQTQVVAGGENNVATGDHAAITGGLANEATGNFAAILGGSDNTASIAGATVSGGERNTASGFDATVGGGDRNTASGTSAIVGGGGINTASGEFSTVGGGLRNTANEFSSTIPGGFENSAAGVASFAAGFRANARRDGTFVWADNNEVEFRSFGPNTWSARCTGGARFVTAINSEGTPTAGVRLASGGGSWSSLSDRNAKEDITPIDTADVLEKVTSMPISTWSYTNEENGARHMGPMAQDFHGAFGLGEDDRHITGIDADGAAFAAIQGLAEKVDNIKEAKESLAKENKTLRERVASVEERLQTIEESYSSPT